MIGHDCEDERNTWRTMNCATRPAAAAVPGLCQRMADRYGILAGAKVLGARVGRHFGDADDQVQKSWTNLACSANASCQRLSDLHAIAHGQAFGLAPTNVIAYWRKTGCATRPAADAIPGLCSQLGDVPNRSGEAQAAWQALACTAAPLNGGFVLTDDQGAWLTHGPQPLRYLSWDNARASAAAVAEGFYINVQDSTAAATVGPTLRYLAGDGSRWETRRQGTGFEIAPDGAFDRAMTVTELDHRDWQGARRKAKTVAQLATEGDAGAAAAAACNRIEPAPISIATTFYRDTEYSGRKYEVQGMQSPDMPDNDATGVGAISSIRLGTPPLLAVWEDRQYQGVCHEIVMSQPNLKAVGWNDRISSWRFGRGCDPAMDVDFKNDTTEHMRFRITYAGGVRGEWHELWAHEKKVMTLKLGVDIAVEIQSETFTMVGPLWGAGPDYLGSGALMAADVRKYKSVKLDNNGTDYTRAIWLVNLGELR